MTDNEYLYDSDGEWVAFIDGDYAWDVDANLIGWVSPSDGRVFDEDGNYAGSVAEGDRLLRDLSAPESVPPDRRMSRPARVSRPPAPLRADSIRLSRGWEDLRSSGWF